ncbi:hypothetical protein MP638_005262, partial [Amoeboaphelidium occidentale]
VVGDFSPLGVGGVVKFCKKIFKYHGLELSQDMLEFVKSHTLLHGRARTIACVLDKYFNLPENERNIEQCYDGFYRVLVNLSYCLNPLRYSRQDNEGRNNRLQRLVADETLQTKLSNAIAEYIVSGYGAVYGSDNLAAQIIHYEIGFGVAIDYGRICNVELLEESVIVCLRSFGPFENIAKTIALEIKPKIKPNLFVYGLEYMVSYSLVALLTNGDRSVLSRIEVYNGSLSDYISDETKDNALCIPDNACGPDIVYKYNNTLYVLQIKFADSITLQKRQNACDTTDPKKFYCERNDPAKVYNGSLSDYISDETKDNALCIPDNACGPDIVYKYNNTLYVLQIKFADSITLEKRQNVCDTTDPKKFYCERNDPAKVASERLLFMHTKTNTVEDIDQGVSVIDATNNPDFFDCLCDDMKDKGKLWAKLRKIKAKLDAPERE